MDDTSGGGDLDGGVGNDTLTGGTAGDYLYGGTGNDLLNGGAGSDNLIGDSGNDTVSYVGAASGITVSIAISTSQNTGGSGFDTLSGFENVTGSAYADSLTGSSGGNIIDGGAGNDTLAGAQGNDTYVVDSGSDVLVEAAASGTDVVQAFASFTLNANVENLVLLGASLNGTGNSLDNTITGNTSHNLLDGGAGNDTLSGGLGDDSYVVDAAGDVVTESGGEGTDTVSSSVTYVLGATLENLSLTGSANISGTGNVLNNSLTGNSNNNVLDGLAGNDLLDGGLGDDTLNGGLGDDTFVVNAIGDGVTEAAGEGADTVQSSVSWALGSNLENLTLTGNANINGTGNVGDNVVFGNSGNNMLDGGDGNDTLNGGLGDDTFFINAIGDVVAETASAGSDEVRSLVSWTLAVDLENLTLTGSANISGTGNVANNVIIGNSGNNLLDGGGGDDSLNAGLGDDSYIVDAAGDLVTEAVAEGTDLVVASTSYVLSANIENLTLGGTGNIDGTGNSGDNSVVGNIGNNRLDGAEGNNSLFGSAGNDTYVVATVNDIVAEAPGDGTDTVESTISYSLAADLENLSLMETADINGTGNSGTNLIVGNSGNNVLDGGAGDDSLAGGLGNDTFIVEASGDVVTEASSEGTDEVQSSITYVLGDHVENLSLTGGASINGSGNSLINILTGNSGNNILTGGLGADSMAGGLGNDTFVVEDIGDVVTEGLDEGTDIVLASATFILGANIENLTLTGTGAINGTGNALNNNLTGNSGNNVLNGAAGNDTLTGGLGNDSYYVDSASDVVVEVASGGTDLILSSVHYSLAGIVVENLTLTGADDLNGTGNGSGNALTGNSGNNVLDGGLANDTMAGGLGNDTYYVQATGDNVVEANGEGSDVIFSSVTYTLSGRIVEVLNLTGLADLNATGNSLANTLNGNAGANLLDGGGGNDTLSGGAGNDTFIVNVTADVAIEAFGEGTDIVQSLATFTLGANIENLVLTGIANINGTGNDLNNSLTGTIGNNALDGGAGVDTMVGGQGNDTYYVDIASDAITEAAGEGTDLVYASVTYSLAGKVVENLTMTGTANLSATGNTLGNKLNGNSGNNSLDGGAGNDTLMGGLGNDTYYVTSTGDKVVENNGEGTDIIYSTVTYTLTGRYAETLELTGSGNVDASGNGVGNTLIGNTGNNTLNGLGGNDILTGGLGADVFLFGIASRADTVTDFSAAQNDTINVNAYTGGVANNGLVVQVGADTVINFGGGNVITVLNATQADVLAHMVW
ncbi:hemolysin-type calcium-binding repeat 2 copies family protein [Asticcacaulis biprosthecium C19]|uniref:Hemolysin-type calcium-binding repeat 2 copies family protein n=1 Tax=Asticcacaulis biprosthecium C19 TaxID=715226 RepID=F4QTX7_9CAUL|nr:calcium-binding protein [Asticcacaulis biprosthecium]EGF89277.1 hemolysin-type calcium-binding repeat 2 copies family protein [Asticcacaulis biprosthecium C19]